MEFYENMYYIIIPYESDCSLKEFIINGIKADVEDFGEIHGRNCTWEEPCYIEFISKDFTKNVLNKYDINIKEYKKICDELNCLSIGYCHLCV